MTEVFIYRVLLSSILPLTSTCQMLLPHDANNRRDDVDEVTTCLNLGSYLKVVFKIKEIMESKDKKRSKNTSHSVDTRLETDTKKHHHQNGCINSFHQSTKKINTNETNINTNASIIKHKQMKVLF